MNNRHIQVVIAVSACWFLTTGCSHIRSLMDVDCCAEIEEGFVPEPAGKKICNWHTAQIKNANQDQGVLYRADFVGASAEISPQANERMRRLIHSGSTENLPWLIEPSTDAVLDQNRVHAVLHYLAQLGSPTRNVMIATPSALGLSGPDAERAAAAMGSNRSSSFGSGLGNGFSGGGF